MKNSRTNDKRVLILSNHHSYTYNFRKELIMELIENGYDVCLSLPYGNKVKLLEDLGCTYYESKLERRGKRIFSELSLIKSYFSLIKKTKPDMVIAYSIKPNIYGGMVCRIKGVPFIANVTGLGTAMCKESFLQKILLSLYSFAIKKAEYVFFQNQSNRDFFLSKKISIEKSLVVPGSGVNINEFTYEDYPPDDGIVRFLFIGRVMRDKGIEELLEAAKRLKKQYHNVQFDVVGFCEDDYKAKFEMMQNEMGVNYHGVTDNVKEYLKRCNAIVHPTYHEGMSNVLLEAAATGRPVIASNIPGCREIFEEGVSGISFEPRSTDSLLQALVKFLNLSNKQREIMGYDGRKRIEEMFNRETVVETYINAINCVLGGNV